MGQVMRSLPISRTNMLISMHICVPSFFTKNWHYVLPVNRFQVRSETKINWGNSMASVLIKNAQIITMNAGEEILEGDLYIENDRIIQVGGDLGYAADQIIDAKNKTVIPGFIQTHIHLC